MLNDSTLKTRVAGIVVKDNSILLLKRIRDGFLYYSAPGGKVEIEESYVQTCIRELMEECSIRVSPTRELMQITDSRDGKKVLNIVYACDYISGIPELSEQEKAQSRSNNVYEPMWVDLEEAVHLNYRSEWLSELVKALQAV